VESKALPLVVGAAGPDRERLVARARLLAWLGIGWHAIEAAIAVGAGIAASSIALIGFGADSVIESIAGFVLIWRFGASRHASEAAEQRAHRLIGVSFWVIAAYVAVEAVRQLAGGTHPKTSWIGIGANALFGWWWADPAAALLIATAAVREGREAWRGDPCCDAC
jgi:divalent metal cation (Fe/Co/Zn/Cd) transporter